MLLTIDDKYQKIEDFLRNIEHESEDADELFYCAYVLALLGLQQTKKGILIDNVETDFFNFLSLSMTQENISEDDQEQILALWERIIESLALYV